MIQSSKHYHIQTSYDRHKMEGHLLDWQNQPSVFKDYPDIRKISLPKQVPIIDTKLSDIVALPRPVEDDRFSLSIDTVSRIILMAYQITGSSPYPGGIHYYRSIPSAGALYPFELYVEVENIEGLEDGLYHYDIRQHELALLRQENNTSNLSEAHVTKLMFFTTVIFFRSAWKYRDRSYRYHLLDTGHLLENFFLTINALSLQFQVDYDFDDQQINRLLGIDEQREACLSIIRIPGKMPVKGYSKETLTECQISYAHASRVAAKEVRYPLVEAVHEMTTRIQATKELESKMILNIGADIHLWKDIGKPESAPDIFNFTEAVSKRRSMRNFIPKAMSMDQFSMLTNLLCMPDTIEMERKLGCGFLVNRVDGIESGIYFLDQSKCKIGKSQDGNIAELMSHVCLNQEWLSNASLHVFFAVNLDSLERTWGNRGYRYAMIDAGRLGQRIYLGATALGLGCCGIGAFYDHEAASLLELDDSSMMIYLLAVGVVKKMFKKNL